MKTIVLSKKFCCSDNNFEYFIGLTCDKKIIPLGTKPPWMDGYIKSFGENKCMSFLITDKQLSKNNMKYRIKLVALLTKLSIMNKI